MLQQVGGDVVDQSSPEQARAGQSSHPMLHYIHHASDQYIIIMHQSLSSPGILGILGVIVLVLLSITAEAHQEKQQRDPSSGKTICR